MVGRPEGSATVGVAMPECSLMLSEEVISTGRSSVVDVEEKREKKGRPPGPVPCQVSRFRPATKKRESGERNREGEMKKPGVERGGGGLAGWVLWEVGRG